MFGWINNLFGKKSKHNKLPNILENSIKSMSKAQAIYEITFEHMQRIKQGSAEYPARNRKNKNVLEVWTFTRIEAFLPFLISEHSNIIILGDFSKQKKILKTWFDKKPHLAFPHAVTDNEIEETIKSIFNIYIGLAKVVEEVGADEISIGGELFNNFNEKMKELKKLWDIDENLTNLPLIFDLLFEDITYKTKVIALCSIFGPDYENMIDTLMQNMTKELQEQGESTEKIKQSMAKIRKNFTDLLLKNDPDH